MSKSTHLLEEFAHVRNNCPPGVYLIPVPPKLSSSPSKSPPSQPQSPFQVSPVDPWQGILFVRNPESPYFNGIFRFEIQFSTFSQIRQHLQPSTIHTRRPYSYDYYPIIQLQSEIHTRDESEKRIAQYCLEGIEPSEQEAIRTGEPFSRTMHVVSRLVEWFDGVNLTHDPDLATTDVKVAQSDTLLYETPRHNDRLITFTSDNHTSDVVGILR